MRIIDVRQGSEEWHKLRLRPTASQFHRIVTPKRADYSAKAIEYACELVAKMLGVWTEPPPSYWMDWGTENEPHAVELYQEMFPGEVKEVGFVLPDHTDTFGGSPDRLIGDDGLLEVKCPAPQTLMKYQVEAIYLPPLEYRPQIQGLLLITGRKWCDFFAYHPELEPFFCRVEPDLEFQSRLLQAIERFLVTLRTVKRTIRKRENVVWTKEEELV